MSKFAVKIIIKARFSDAYIMQTVFHFWTYNTSKVSRKLRG
jgi:hypothetical protein